jgi:drug/metabolite transporter (DMT)-like permease
MGIIFALLSAFSFGISNVWWNKAATNDDFSRIVFFRGVIAVLVFGIMWLVFHFSGSQSLLIKFEQASYTDYLKTIFLCFACSLGLVFFLTSLRYAPVSIIVPLSSVNIFNILTAVFILEEVFKPVYAFSFLLAGSGAWFIHVKNNTSAEKWNPGVVYALLAAFFWGVTYALFKYPARWLGAVPLAFILETCVMITALVWNLVVAEKQYRFYAQKSLKPFFHYGLLAILLVGGTLFFNLAIQLVDVLLLNITGNLSILTAVLLGPVLLKEKINTKQALGIVLIIVSLLLVQLF